MDVWREIKLKVPSSHVSNRTYIGLCIWLFNGRFVEYGFEWDARMRFQGLATGFNKKINKIRTKNHGDRCVMVVVVVVFRDRYPNVKFIEMGRRGSITMSLSSHQPITGVEYRTGYVKTLIKTKELISDLEKMEFLSNVLTNPNLKFYKTPPMPADGKGRRYNVVLEKTNRRK